MLIRLVALVVALAFLASPVAAEAQSAGKVWRIGVVPTGTPDTVGHFAKAIEASLAAAGYVHGRNITLVHQVAPPQPAGAEEVLRAIVPTIDILIVGSTVGSAAAKKVTTTLPTVFMSVGDPIRLGLVSSLAHPGGNMTGITFDAAEETYGKRLQLLKEILPNLTTVGVLRAFGDANATVVMESLERVAPVLRVTLRGFDFKTGSDLDRTFAAMKTSGVQGILVVAGALAYAHGGRIAELALAHRLPSAHAFKETVAVGGLLSLGPDLIAVVQQAAAYVDKIIKGAKPRDLPVEQPARYEIYVNLKTARTLGLTIPPSLLLRADHVIE